jgi:hypothetical protein
MDEGALSLDLVLMSDEQLRHGALVEANRRIAELERHMANVQQRAREAVLGSATALREAELMRDSHFANLQTSFASIAKLREALTGAREFVATEAEKRDSGDKGWAIANKDEYFSGPRKLLTKIDAALQAAPVTSGSRPRDLARRRAPAPVLAKLSQGQ